MYGFTYDEIYVSGSLVSEERKCKNPQTFSSMQVLQERATLSNSLNGISLEADWKEEKIVLTADKVHEIFRHISDEDCFILKMDPEFARTACFELIGEKSGKECAYKQCHEIALKFFCNSVIIT